MFRRYTTILSVGFFIAAVSAVFGANQGDSTDKYTLAYRFNKGDTLRWEVLQQLRIKTTVAGQSEVVDTISLSTKLWTVIDVDENGTALVEHKVEDVNMHKKQADKKDSSFNSKTDKDVPMEYEQVSSSLNIPLSKLSIAKTGEVMKKTQLVPYTAGTLDSKILIPLPKHEVAVGDEWKVPEEIQIPQANGTVKKIVIQKVFALESVKNGLAIVKYRTACLTPMDDPKLEVQVIDKLDFGRVELDLDTGHILLQQADVQGSVLGFAGEMSSVDHRGRFVETMKK